MNKRTIGLALIACGVALATGPAPGSAQLSLDELAIRAFDITVELSPVPLQYEYYGSDLQFTSHGTLRGTTVAQLEVTATSPVTTARLELDRDVKLTSVAAPGYQVAPSRLRDTLTLTFTPALPAGGKVPLTFVYEGGPDYIYNEFVLVEEGSLYPLLISPFGDYSANFARVLLKVTTPGGYNIAGTGKLISRDGNTSTWDSEVPVPWVAVAGGQKHTVRDRTVADVQMQFYVPPGEDRNLDKLADFAGRSVDYYSKLLYPFPYSQLRTVSLFFVVGGGIGYPAFLLINDRAFRNTLPGDLNRDSYLFHLIAHEILHSYVPSQTVPKGAGFIWLSEGFAEYLSLMAVETLMGPEAFKRELQEERTLYASVVATTTEPPLGAITFTNYQGGARRSIYAKGSLVLHMLRGVVGDEVFRKGLAAYFAAYRGKAARVSDFQEVMEQVSGQSLDWFFREWIQGRVLPNYTIVRAKSTPLADGTFQTSAVVRNLGRGEMPVEVGFTTTDGEVVIQKLTVFSEGDSTVSVTTSKPVKQVEVDPHQWIIQRDYTHKVFQVQ